MKPTLPSAAVAALLLAAPPVLRGGETNETVLPPDFQLWHPSLSLRVGAGYQDNVMLSSFDPQGSGFETVSGEFMLTRLPWENWQVNLLAAGQDTRYFDDSAGVDAEQNVAVSGQFVWFPHNDWRTLTTAEYSYLNQVMDVSATYGTAVRAQVIGHGLTARQGLRADLGPWFTEATFSGSRYDFQQPFDDYWQFGPNLIAGRYYGHGSEVSLLYSLLPLHYETREAMALDGTLVPGSSLQFLPHHLELTWQHDFDPERVWRTTLRLSLERSTDNATGYYDYWQYGCAGQVRYRPAGWELQVRAGLFYYDFDHQPVSSTDLSARHRTAVQAGLRAQRNLTAHWKLSASYGYQRSLSNLDLDRYAAHTGSGGLEFGF